MYVYSILTKRRIDSLEALEMRVTDGDLTFWAEKKLIRTYARGSWYEARLEDKERKEEEKWPHP